MLSGRWLEEKTLLEENLDICSVGLVHVVIRHSKPAQEAWLP